MESVPFLRKSLFAAVQKSAFPARFLPKKPRVFSSFSLIFKETE